MDFQEIIYYLALIKCLGESDPEIHKKNQRSVGKNLIAQCIYEVCKQNSGISCYASKTEIVSKTGLSKQRIQKCIKSKDFLDIFSVKTGRGKGHKNHYTYRDRIIFDIWKFLDDNRYFDEMREKKVQWKKGFKKKIEGFLIPQLLAGKPLDEIKHF